MHWIALQPAPDTALAGTQGAASLADAATAWAWWALQFTPLVAHVEAALVMEVSSQTGR
jgi:protein ImuB